MTMQILVPMDGSRFSEQAIPSAYKIAQLNRARVHLVRVLGAPRVVASEMGLIDGGFDAEQWQSADDYLVTHARRAPLGVQTRSVTLTGPVVKSLTAYVASAGIDMIIMTTHGRTGLGRAWLGSVADGLVRSVKVPVVLLRPQKGANGPEVEPLQLRRILIPLDGSDLAEQAVESAVQLGWLTGARYTLMQVVNPVLPETYADIVEQQMHEPDYELEHMRTLSREYLETTAERLRAVGLRVETVVVTHTETTAGIVQQAMASEADLIAMATHGRGGWKRFVLGSVAQGVLHRAHLPLLVLRTQEAAVTQDRYQLAAH
jgi:nucleotide-binding universal stress UspA family protein